MSLYAAFRGISLILFFVAGTFTAYAQDYPVREIHSIANVPPGTGMDIMIRYYGAKLGQLAGKPVVVENKPGAQGNIATEYLVRSKSDGYTIMMTPASATLAAAVSLFKKLPFDPLKDLRPVIALSQLGFVLAVNNTNSAKTILELTNELKQKSGNGAYGTVSNTGIITAELYKSRTGLETNQVLYRGFLENLNDLLSDQLDFIATDPTSAAAAMQSGKIRPLAVTSVERLAALPDVPTMIEAGFPNFDVTPWIGLFVPAGTPDTIVRKLAAWHRTINDDDETRRILVQFGMNSLNEDASAMGAHLRDDIVKWASYVSLAKIEPQ